jgi:3-oxoadipate enol-lactonase
VEPDADESPPVDDPVVTPDLPLGQMIDLGDLGTIAVRCFGRPDGPVVMLLHGWTATADLNWFKCYAPLAEHYRVIAFDHRGHGNGLRTRKRFRLEDCADDAVLVADALGVDRFIAVGYSMGGPVAQLIWRRHPERIDGLVLCATAPVFNGERLERWSFAGLGGLAALARVTPGQARTWLTDQLYLNRKVDQWEPWAMQEAARHDWRMLLEAGKAIGAFSSVDWIGSVDVPVSLVVTMGDHVVSRRRQTRLFELIRDATVFRVDGDHDACVAEADQFVPSLTRALVSVREQSDIPSARSTEQKSSTYPG